MQTPGLPVSLPIGRRHEGRGLLMPGDDELDRRFADGFDDVEVFLAGNSEDSINALVLEGGDEKIGTFGHPSDIGGWDRAASRTGRRPRSFRVTSTRRVETTQPGRGAFPAASAAACPVRGLLTDLRRIVRLEPPSLGEDARSGDVYPRTRRFTATRSSSRTRGLSNSTAPTRSARLRVSRSPKAVIRMTGMRQRASNRRSNISSPE